MIANLVKFNFNEVKSYLLQKKMEHFVLWV